MYKHMREWMAGPPSNSSRCRDVAACMVASEHRVAPHAVLTWVGEVCVSWVAWHGLAVCH